MYTRQTTFPLKPNSADQADEIAQKYGKVIHALPGHVSTIMFVDGDSFTSITTWDNEEQAQAVSRTRDDAQNDLTDLLAGAPSTTISVTTLHDVS